MAKNIYQANALKNIIPTIEVTGEGPISGGPITISGLTRYQSVEWDVPVTSVTGETSRDVTTRLYTDFMLPTKRNLEDFYDIIKGGSQPNDRKELPLLNEPPVLDVPQSIIFNAQSFVNDTNGLTPLHGSATIEDFGIAFKQASEGTIIPY